MNDMRMMLQEHENDFSKIHCSNEILEQEYTQAQKLFQKASKQLEM